MTTVGIIAAVTVLGPLFAALACFVKPKSGAVIGISAALLVAASAVFLVGRLPDVGAQLIALGGWIAPLGIQWRIDGLTVLMLALTGSIGATVGFYARAYFAPRTIGAVHFWPLSMLLLAGLNALFLANDLFNLYVTLEIVGLSSVALVTLTGTRSANEAAFRYLLVSLLGSLLYLAGVALIYRGYGTLDMLALSGATRGDTATWLAVALMLGGLLLKSAVFPLHFWLAPAHSIAPAPVSAILSALVVKGSLVVLLRLWQDVVPEMPNGSLGLVLGITGAAATLWGSFYAVRAARLKLLVAYSTVAQLGYVMLYFSLSSTPSAATAAWTGATYLILAHGVAKAALFMAAGNLQRAAAHDDLQRLGAAATALPLTMLAFGLAGASIMGLPPSGGFVAKWTLLEAALSAQQWQWIGVLLLGGLLAAAYVFRVLQLAFEPRNEAATSVAPLPRAMEWAPLALAMGAIALGFAAPPIFDILRIELSSPAVFVSAVAP